MKIKSRIKKIFTCFLCLMILFTNIYKPLMVKASVAPPIRISGNQVYLNFFQQLGVLISMATGLDINAFDDGNPLTRHDLARFGYDYLISKGFDRVALNTIASVAFMDPDWKEPISANELLAGDLSGLDIDEILAVTESQADAFDVYMSITEDGKSIFDTLPDFVSSVLDGTNTLKLGNKTITADAITGFDDYQMDANGNYIVNVIASYFGGGYDCVDSSINVKPVLVRSGPNVNGIYSFAFMRKANTSNSLLSHNFQIANRVTVGSEISSTRIFSALSSYDSLPLTSSIPIFDSNNDALAFINYGTRTGMVNDAASSTGKFDYTAIANNVVSKIFPLITGAAISVKGLYDAYAGTRDKIKGGSITDTPAYIDSVVNVMQGIQTLDKVIAGEETPTLPDSGADILEWVKTIASAVVVIPTELRKLSLSALESSVVAIADIFPALRQDLKAIADSFPALRQDVKTIGDVFPALRSDLKGIADDFPAVRKTLDAIGDSFPALKQGLDSITDVFPSMVDYQARFLPKIGDISDTLNALSARYKELVDSLSDSFPDIRDKLGSILGVLDLPLSGVLDVPLSGIADKVDGISDTLTGFKDFTLTLPDYTGLLKDIIGILNKILLAVLGISDWFTLDMDAVASAIADVKTDVFSDSFIPYVAFFDRLHFTDTCIYPKIVFPTPMILQSYIQESEIVLCDFEDYAQYFIWVRTIIRFILWFGVLLWIIRQFKVTFTIA